MAYDMDKLVELYGSAVYGFCRRLCGKNGSADDLYQQTFLRAMELHSKIEPSGNPKGFLIALAARLWRSSRARNARRGRIAPAAPANPEVPADGCLEDAVAQKLLDEHLNALVRALPDKLRITAIMYYGTGLSVFEIASSMHVPQGTVKSRLHKARLILKNGLEGYGYGEIK